MTLLAVLALASGGLWSMLVLVSLALLATTIYGTVLRRPTWLHLPRRRAIGALGAAVALVLLMGSASAYGASHPSATPPSDQAPVAAGSPTARLRPAAIPDRGVPTRIPTPTPSPVITTKIVTETSAVPFSSTTVQSPTLAQGTSTVTTAGVPGVETTTYVVTYTDGAETSRAVKSQELTTQPVTEVTAVGTYVAPPPPPAPSCTDGTYVNSAGVTVCRPEAASSAPPGATARCSDGTYSFSQSRRGTCSSHGGVSIWL